MDVAHSMGRDRATVRTGLIDRYILRETAKPLALSLVVVLMALLLERILRLFDLLANKGGPFDLVIKMAANLVPHYLGLALPAAFFISIFVVMAKFGDDNELDALQSSGLSIHRIARPLLGLGLGLAVLSIALFGFIQPYSRYAYQAIFFAATNAAWDATLPQAAFIDVGEGITVTADAVDPTGRELERVFVHQRRGDSEWITTAMSGRVGMTADRRHVLLTLENGVQLRTGPDGTAQALRFGRLTLDKEFSLDVPPFRPRGGSERELTLLELWRESRASFTLLPREHLVSEFHARLVRALTLPLLPLLAVPMGMAAKRARRGVGIAVAAVILVVYNHSIQFAESLADLGRIPGGGVWVPFLMFAALCAWLFHRADARPGENPFARTFDSVEAVLHNVGRLIPKRRYGRREGAP